MKALTQNSVAEIAEAQSISTASLLSFGYECMCLLRSHFPPEAMLQNPATFFFSFILSYIFYFFQFTPPLVSSFRFLHFFSGERVVFILFQFNPFVCSILFSTFFFWGGRVFFFLSLFQFTPLLVLSSYILHSFLFFQFTPFFCSIFLFSSLFFSKFFRFISSGHTHVYFMSMALSLGDFINSTRPTTDHSIRAFVGTFLAIGSVRWKRKTPI